MLWPLSEGGFEMWNARSESDIRSALRSKVVASAKAKSLESSLGGQSLGA